MVVLAALQNFVLLPHPLLSLGREGVYLGHPPVQCHVSRSSYPVIQLPKGRYDDAPRILRQLHSPQRPAHATFQNTPQLLFSRNFGSTNIRLLESFPHHLPG
jgi:hypothetical protein